MYFDYLREPLPPLYELARPDRWKFDYNVTSQHDMGMFIVRCLYH
jgi:hypothetical protein